MANGNPSRFEKSPALWWIAAVVVGLNLWFDYYHPVWLILDAVVLLVVIVKRICRD
jgi:hypothetical protein